MNTLPKTILSGSNEEIFDSSTRFVVILRLICDANKKII